MTDFSNILLHWMCFMFQDTNNNSKSFRWSSSAHSIQFPSPFRLVWWSNKSPINVPLPMKLLVQEFVPFSSLLLGPLITSSISLAFFLPPPPPSLARPHVVPPINIASFLVKSESKVGACWDSVVIVFGHGSRYYLPTRPSPSLPPPGPFICLYSCIVYKSRPPDG